MFNPPNTFSKLADAYFGLNDKSNAIATINKGLSLYPNDGSMWTYAGMFYKSKINDIGKATEHYNKAAQLGDEAAKRSLGYIAEEKQSIAEEKQRKKARRNAAILAVMGAVNQTLETYNTSRQKPATSQNPQSNTPSNPQTTQSGGTSNANSNQNSGNDCPPYTGSTQSTNTGAAEPGTQKEYSWNEWQTHPGYKGLLMRTRPMFQQKGQPYWYFEMEIKNNYQEEVSMSAYTSDKCKMRNNEINELYSDGSVVNISPGGTGRETYLRSASFSQVRYWITMFRKNGNGKIAKHDDGSLPLKCQIYPNDQFCPGQP